MCQSSSEDAQLVWEVHLPDRKRAYLGASHPKGSVSFKDDEGTWQHLSVPAEACRVLRRKKKGDEIRVQCEDDLKRAIEDATYTGAKNVALRLVARRDYSRKEALEKLALHGFGTSVSQRVVQELIDIHAIDDSRFADVFIRSKINAGWGLSRIERELSRRGVAAKAIEGWPYEYTDPDDELERATEIAQRKRVSAPNAWQKLVRFLVGRGFGLDVAKRAATAALADGNE